MALDIEVTGAPTGQVPAIEEAAILHANGQSQAAHARLVRAIASEPLGAAAEQVWLMLLEVYQALGEQAQFEARALEFAMLFERSAPVWRGAPVPAVDPRMRTGGGAYVALSGTLSPASAAQIERLRGVADRNRMLRVDYSKLQGVEAQGCRLLLDALQALRRRGTDAMFTGEATLLGLLAAQAREGARDVDPALWLLRLEILQWQGRQKEFEELALAYAVTYELSPPSFETRAAALAAGMPVQAAEEGTLRAPAEILGGAPDFIGQLEQAAGRGALVVDCSALRRVDFVSAGALLNAANRWRAAGRRVEMRDVNALVAALLEVIGVSSLIPVVTRR